MTRPIKERLLGGLLLVALAVIFLPMLLDGDGLRQGRLQSVVPPAPAPIEIVHYEPQNKPHPDTTELADPRPTSEQQLPEPPEPLDPPAEEQANAAEQAEQKPANVVAAVPAASQMTTEKPVLDQQGVPAGWTLQLASFKERANAVNLQQQLLKRGYKAYIRDKAELSKVYVGPDLQKSRIQALKAELKRDLKLDGLVLRFRP